MGVRALAVVLVTTVLATLAIHEAFAQMVVVAGQVTDTWGNPLEGVEVEAKRQDGGGAMRSASTDADGEFQMVGIEPATYEFTYRLSEYLGARQVGGDAARLLSSSSCWAAASSFGTKPSSKPRAGRPA